MAVETDIRVMVPLVRRAVLGVAPADPLELTDDQVKDLTADAVAEIILYAGSIFGKQLVVTDTDGTSGAPTEYATSDALTLQEQIVVASQAALNHFFFRIVNAKTSERIQNEGVEWEWQTSASVMRDQFKQLIDRRDKALAALGNGQILDAFESFLAVRDVATANVIEPWAAVGYGGQEFAGRSV